MEYACTYEIKCCSV